MNRIPILLCGNARVFDGMVICALSIVRHHTGPIDLFVFTMDLSERDPAFTPVTASQCDLLASVLREVNPESRVRLVDCKPYYLETLADAPNQNTQYTPYAFLRLYADRVPEMPPKLIYLDTDTVLCGDIASLWSVDLGRAEFGAVRDYYGCRFFGINYLNSGVLLLNLPRIRETGLFRRALALCARRKIFLADQTAQATERVTALVALPIKTYALVTMNKQGWLTRRADLTGGEGQDEASLSRAAAPAAVAA